MISGDKISVIRPFFKSNLIENEVIHIYQNFAGRLWKHLNAKANHGVYEEANGILRQMELWSAKHFLIFRKDILVVKRGNRAALRTCTVAESSCLESKAATITSYSCLLNMIGAR